MSNTTHEKLKLMRESERLSQREFCEMTGVPHGSYAQYEQGRSKPGLDATIKIFSHPRFRKYRDWFMFDETNPAAGQIAPVLSLSGQEIIELSQSGKKIG
ncbi:helix-turn-helix transcriptional regulator [uncultured Serratia sp.]|uniref:helix-turn-helix domain-containing protein n=1 Tax=uncultured Serratia sp. TaxID=239175 RepID=UPI0025870D84|nr:helix-turn-helix transcriptional regulator [uncultured Serratia sp.]